MKPNLLDHMYLRRLLGARFLSAVLTLTALAVPNSALAGAFANTYLTPSAQTVDVGTPVSVNIVLNIPSDTSWGLTNGVQAWVNFDPTKLQVTSINNGPSSPFSNVSVNEFNNSTGTLSFKALGGSVGGSTITVATIVFTPIAAGASNIQFSNVNQYINNSPYGINGGSGPPASITVNEPPPPPLPTQTLTILGGSGNTGDIAANVEYYNPATGNWQPAYLMGYHPWGYVTGTNSWINYKPSSASDPGAGPTTNQTLWYLYRVRFTVPTDAINPKMTFSLKADNYAQVAINGMAAGGSTTYLNYQNMPNVISGSTDQFNADAVFSQAVQPGENTITINMGDWGGLNGFNFRIDLSMQSSQPLEIVPTEPADTTPPVISGPGNITTEATGPSGAVVSFSATAVDDVDGPVPVTAIPPSGSTFALGTTVVGLGAMDAAGNIASATFDVMVQDTTPPIITSPADITAEATSAAGAVVTFDVSADDIVDGPVPAGASPASGSTFPLGLTTVDVSATDAHNNTATTSFSVSVVDTTAPVITSVTPSTGTLWSPNHKMVPITVTVSSSDNTGVTSLKIVSVTSSEPDNGLGDGDTPNDSQITGPLTVNLRAERSGKGNGRIYTIMIEATDAYGNSSTSSCTVAVPKSQGKGK